MSQNSFKIVIPARFGSSRLPGKPLLDIAGKPMIQHVFERAVETGLSPDGDIVVATDDQRIVDVCNSFGALAVMTAADHTSGTDRLAEVAEKCGWQDDAIIINLQGDEPLMPAHLIRKVGENLAANPLAGIATFSTPIDTTTDMFDSNIVKVVTNQAGMALYFSRAPIPWDRDNYNVHNNQNIQLAMPLPERHLGMYAYRSGTLKQIASAQPADIELQESLEQLRALWLGFAIHVESIAEQPGHGVDTPEDLERVRAILSH